MRAASSGFTTYKRRKPPPAKTRGAKAKASQTRSSLGLAGKTSATSSTCKTVTWDNKEFSSHATSAIRIKSQTRASLGQSGSAELEQSPENANTPRPFGARRCSWARRSRLSHRIILRWDKGAVPLSRFALPNGCLPAYAWPVAASMPARRPSTMVRPQARPVNRFG